MGRQDRRLSWAVPELVGSLTRERGPDRIQLLLKPFNANVESQRFFVNVIRNLRVRQSGVLNQIPESLQRSFERFNLGPNAPNVLLVALQSLRVARNIFAYLDAQEDHVDRASCDGEWITHGGLLWGVDITNDLGSLLRSEIHALSRQREYEFLSSRMVAMLTADE